MEEAVLVDLLNPALMFALRIQQEFLEPVSTVVQNGVLQKNKKKLILESFPEYCILDGKSFVNEKFK